MRRWTRRRITQDRARRPLSLESAEGLNVVSMNYRRTAFLPLGLMSLLGTATAAHAAGELAVAECVAGTSSPSIGVIIDRPTLDIARSEAIAACKGTGCRIVASVRQGCMAIATGMDCKNTGIGVGANADEAGKSALGRCIVEQGHACIVANTYCDTLAVIPDQPKVPDQPKIPDRPKSIQNQPKVIPDRPPLPGGTKDYCARYCQPGHQNQGVDCGVCPDRSKVIHDRPMVGGVAVDWCARWASGCGQEGADQFCRSRGQPRALSFETFAPGRTIVLGDRRICAAEYCVGLSRVICAVQ